VPTAIRPCLPGDAPALQVIECLAGERFREVGLADVADNEPASVDTLAHYATAGRGWVAVDESGEPVGFVVVDVVDANAHVEQVSVLPDHQGAGIGRALLDRVRAWAVQNGRSAITLTTFADVPWNAPLYRHLGFRVLAEGEIGPELRAICFKEAAHGLDPTTRVCMRLDVRA
jgi:GNAT superfamily N-acetyltransferase